MKIEEITLWRAKLGLKRPYKIAVFTYYHFDAIFLRVIDSDGRAGWGETIIRPGYNHETPDSAHRLLASLAQGMVGQSVKDGKAHAMHGVQSHPYALSALVMALEMLEQHPVLKTLVSSRIPLLAPVAARSADAIATEVDQLLVQGFRTLKVKVGFNVEDDLARIDMVRRASAGQALIRLDANNAFSQEDGQRFASLLDPAAIELLEQPCAADDWHANAEVAARSTVPVMLDEPIWGIPDIDRAAAVPNVRYAKLKLKKAGGLDRLINALRHMRDVKLEPVLGDGVATDLMNWMEACVARSSVSTAGEMNGFLKLSRPLLDMELPFRDGAIELPVGFSPQLDERALSRLEHHRKTFTAVRSSPARTHASA